MAYYNELSFASGYYHINIDGVVEISDDMPAEMRERFWKVWPSFWAETMRRVKTFQLSSKYPVLPYMEEDPNRAQYEHLLK